VVPGDCVAATHCNTLQHTATHCSTLLQHTASHCNILHSDIAQRLSTQRRTRRLRRSLFAPPNPSAEKGTCVPWLISVCAMAHMCLCCDSSISVVAFSCHQIHHSKTKRHVRVCVPRLISVCVCVCICVCACHDLFPCLAWIAAWFRLAILPA